MRRDEEEDNDDSHSGREPLLDEDLYFLVNTLNDWVGELRKGGNKDETCDVGSLMFSAYSTLVDAGLLDKQELMSLEEWIDGLEKIGQPKIPKL